MSGSISANRETCLTSSVNLSNTITNKKGLSADLWFNPTPILMNPYCTPHVFVLMHVLHQLHITFLTSSCSPVDTILIFFYQPLIWRFTLHYLKKGFRCESSSKQVTGNLAKLMGTKVQVSDNPIRRLCCWEISCSKLRHSIDRPAE